MIHRECKLGGDIHYFQRMSKTKKEYIPIAGATETQPYIVDHREIMMCSACGLVKDPWKEEKTK